jgi:hypothetical protein
MRIASALNVCIAFAVWLKLVVSNGEKLDEQRRQ